MEGKTLASVDRPVREIQPCHTFSEGTMGNNKGV